jgi:DNA-directed RNA polymerase specialized sigma54-like protein
LIIGNIDDYGYLKATLEELADSTAPAGGKMAAVLK